MRVCTHSERSASLLSPMRVNHKLREKKITDNSNLVPKKDKERRGTTFIWERIEASFSGYPVQFFDDLPFSFSLLGRCLSEEDLLLFPRLLS